MAKKCFDCMKDIPLLAHRCPYCREGSKESEMYIRIILLIAFIAGLLYLANQYGQKTLCLNSRYLTLGENMASATRSEAARKAWRTRRSNARKRSEAARKAWRTRRANAGA